MEKREHEVTKSPAKDPRTYRYGAEKRLEAFTAYFALGQKTKAAEKVGICRDTLSDWINKYPEEFEKVRKAITKDLVNLYISAEKKALEQVVKTIDETTAYQASFIAKNMCELRLLAETENSDDQRLNVFIHHVNAEDELNDDEPEAGSPNEESEGE